MREKRKLDYAFEPEKAKKRGNFGDLVADEVYLE
jgi:hypothetical protein